MPSILEGKKILVTGVLTPASIAFAIADAAQKEGADIVLTSFGRVMSLTEKSARRMKPTPEILEMDVNKQEQIDTLAQTLKQRWGRLDGFVHAIAFAPGDALGGNFMTAPWESVQTAFQALSEESGRDRARHPGRQRVGRRARARGPRIRKAAKAEREQLLDRGIRRGGGIAAVQNRGMKPGVGGAGDRNVTEDDHHAA